MIDFTTLQNATHPVFVFQPNGMNINVNLSGGAGKPIGWNGPLQVNGTVLSGCLPPGWTPSAAAFSACGGREPWVMLPMAALENLIRSKWGEAAPLGNTDPLRRLEAPKEEKSTHWVPGFGSSNKHEVTLDAGEVQIGPVTGETAPE